MVFRPTAAFRREDVRDDRDPHPAGRSAVSWSLRRPRYSRPSTVVIGSPERLRHLRHRQIRPEPQRDDLPLLIGQPRQRPAQVVAVRRRRAAAARDRRHHLRLQPLHRPPLRRAAPAVVADPVDGDRVEPGRLARAVGVVLVRRAQRSLEDVGHQVLGQGVVAALPADVREQRPGVLAVHPFEAFTRQLLLAHQLSRPCCVVAAMTDPNHDLDELTARLRRERPDMSDDAFARVHDRVVAQAPQRRRTPRTSLATALLIATGLIFTGGGASLAVSGLASDTTAVKAQYAPPAAPPVPPAPSAGTTTGTTPPTGTQPGVSIQGGVDAATPATPATPGRHDATTPTTPTTRQRPTAMPPPRAPRMRTIRPWAAARASRASSPPSRRRSRSSPPAAATRCRSPASRPSRSWSSARCSSPPAPSFAAAHSPSYSRSASERQLRLEGELPPLATVLDA